MNTGNHRVLDLKSVAYADGFWRNQYGHTRRLKPKRPTTFNSEFNPNEYASHHRDYPLETMMERAKRLDILDVWTFVERFQLRNSHSVSYTGKKARAMQQAWNEKVFGKK